MASQCFAQYPSLDNVPVLIPGGATGIGASMVEHFALQGAKVAFIDRAEEAAHELIRQLADRCSQSPRFWSCDLKDVATLRTVAREIENEMGAVRVLVNNAANDDRHKPEEITPEYWDDRMAVNLRHHFFLIQSLSPGMIKAGGGSIINMS